jgi:hypothetical protein
MYSEGIKASFSKLVAKLRPSKENINLISLVLLAIGTVLCTIGGAMIKKIHNCNEASQDNLPEECSTPAFKQSTNVALVLFGSLSLLSGVSGLLYSCLSNYSNIRKMIFTDNPNLNNNTRNVEEPLLGSRKHESPIMESISSEEYNKAINENIINNFNAVDPVTSVNLSTIYLHKPIVESPMSPLLTLLKEKLWGSNRGLTNEWDVSLGEADKSIYYSASEEDLSKRKEAEVVDYFIAKASASSEPTIPPYFKGHVKQLQAKENKNRMGYNPPLYVPPSSFEIE